MESLREPLLPTENATTENESGEYGSEMEENAPAPPSNPDDDDTGTNLPTQEPPQCKDPWRNHNVILSLILCVVAGVADSIWGSVVLSGFLLAMAKSMGRSSTANTLVGTAEAVEGLTQLAAALPIGYIADIWGKARIVRLGGVLMLVTIAVTLFSLYDIVVVQDDHESKPVTYQSYIILVVALGLWGVVNGISFGPSQALYADSIAQGKRSEMLTWLYSCYLVSSSVGPIVSIILTLTVSSHAEDWSIHQLYPVFFAGICLEIPAAIIMFFFSEKHVVPDEDPNAPTTEEEQNGDTVDNDANNDDPSQPLLSTNDDTEADATEETLQQTDTRTSQTIIPVVLFASSLIVSLGSGASVKYFPLFFKEVGFSNVEVQAIFLAVPLVIAVFSFVAQRLGKFLGRVEATVAFDVVGVSLLYFMTWLSENVDDNDENTLRDKHPQQAYFIVAIYLLRTAIMNCSYPLLESMMMDAVPSNQRARWKSLESIAAFGWTGSALLGGILSDAHSYQFTFSITATMQLVGALIILPIRKLVPDEGEETRDATTANSTNNAEEEE